MSERKWRRVIDRVAGEPKDLQIQHLKLMVDVTRKVATLNTLDDVLRTLIEIVVTETGAERGSLFLNDETTGELYSRITSGTKHREIRILNTNGIAGHVFSAAKGVIIHDAYADPRFDPTVDMETGFVTRNILCAPIRTVRGQVIGVVQALNKGDGPFTEVDLELLQEMCTQAAITLQSTQYVEKMAKSREEEMEFLDIVSDVTSELELKPLLQRVMAEAVRMLKADRGTLFMNDDKTNELWAHVGGGIESAQIRFPNHLGIAGTVFTSGRTINIPHAYADLRFNPTFDKKTGYFTRSILCVPVINKEGKVIGVTQVLNKAGGPFTDEDESRLKAFTAQISIALENAKLFDEVQTMKNYNEAVLESMSSGVITLDDSGKIVTCNAAGFRIMHVKSADILTKKASDFFIGGNAWLLDKVAKVEETQAMETYMDAGMEFGGNTLSVNVTVLPLKSPEKKKLGSMIMFEDISSEKRLKSTMSRYMDPGLADQLLAGGEDALGGKSVKATILFSDIRSFTTLTEELGPQATVSMLNEYFTIMVDCITREGGMLDKFIGDAIMAAFGLPIAHDDDEDRAMRASISMLRDLHVFNIARQKDGKKPIDMGIGLNTDVVVSGNIGSPKRMDYTVIGDGVNLASRLESACKQYGARLLISQFTVAKLKGTYRMREVDRVVVKGKTEPVGVFEVLDYHTDETFPKLQDVVNQFRDGIDKYRRGDWDRAIGSFTECLAMNPADKAAEMYVKRCQYLKLRPPGGDWNGVWVMTDK